MMLSVWFTLMVLPGLLSIGRCLFTYVFFVVMVFVFFLMSHSQAG